MGTKILQAALALHDRVSSQFRKTAINFHYEFTVRPRKKRERERERERERGWVKGADGRSRKGGKRGGDAGRGEKRR